MFSSSFPDLISSRDKVLEAIDEFAEENNINYTRNNIKTIVPGKNIPNLDLKKSCLLSSFMEY
eukprot:snap_masked-scaffold_22-processed-gene-3.24-mRNA-1 protein AED:1.00 eAED:1.00 QI:0/-1/0/0/-1/1/1/0/62